MRRFYACLVCLFLVYAMAPFSARASHAAGGEIAYQWIADSTYRIYFKFYRDCGGSGEGPTVSLCYRNSCNTSQGGSINLTKITKLPDSTVNGSPVSPGCPPTATKCQNTSSAVPGYREWWYTNTVTLPSCSLWTFSVVIGARNSSMNITGQVNFYVEATLNNVIAQGNSSPFFSVKPVPSVCINQPYTYNNGAVDPNSDSLVFEVITPLTSNTACPRTVSNTNTPSASPSYNTSTNPIQTGNSFSLSSSTGQMTFTPTQVGAGTITLRVKEYRNGVLIGTVMRDVQVQIINCAVKSPIVNTVSGSITGATYVSGRVEACAGVPLSFCFDLKSADTAAILVASDNHNAAAPGSNVNYVGQLTDSIRGCLTWTPGTLDTGLRVFSVTAKDSTCLSPGVAVSQTFVLPIYIWPVTDIIKDTTICLGDSVQLLAVGGSVFTWSVIPGGSPLSTLSCTNCKQPYAKPIINTQYVVNNSSASYCSKNKDTVSVNVLDYSAIVPNAGSNSPRCTGDTIFLTTDPMLGYTYVWTGPASFTSSSQNPFRINALTTHGGNYIIRGTRNNCYTSADTVNVIVNQTPATPVAINNGPLCSGDTLSLTTASVTGATYSWTGPNTFTSASQNPSIINIDTFAKGVYSVITTKDGCSSLPGNTTVTVNQTPDIDTTSFTNPSTCSGTQGSITLTGLLNTTTYTVNYKKNGVAQTPASVSTNSSGTLTISGLGQGIYSQITVRINGCTSDTTAPIILADPTPPVISFQSSVNPTTCLGNNGSINIIGLTSGLTYTVNYTKNSVSQTPLSLTASVSGSVTISNLTAGSYDNITAKINNCTSNSIGVILLTDPALPVVIAANNGPLCPGDTIKLTATGPLGTTYSWTGPNSFASGAKDTIIINAATGHSGVYEVTGVLNNCTSLSSGTTVTVNPTPATPVAGNNGPLCSGDTLELTSSTITNAAYAWTGPNVFTASTQNPIRTDVDTFSKGDYAVVATVNGCQSLPGITNVVIFQTPVIDTNSFTNPATCGGTEGTISLTGLMNNTSYTVNYKKNGTPQTPATISSNGSGFLTISGLGQGTYSQITVTLNGCSSDTTSSIVLIDPTPPTIAFSTSTNPTTCLGNEGTITIDGVTSGLTYTINYKKNNVSQAPVSQTASLAGALTINNLTAGIYDSIKVTINNCTSNSVGPDTLTDPLPPVIGASNNTPVCQGDTIELTGSGPLGTTYNWTGPNSFTSSSKDTIIANALPSHSGVYELTGTLHNCTSLPSSTSVTVHPIPATPVAGNNGPLCTGSTLNLTSSTVTNATYSWTGPVTYTSSAQNPTRLNVDTFAKGIYSVVATVNGCASLPGTTNVVIYQVPEIDTNLFTNPTTCGGSQGTITINGLLNTTLYTVNYKRNGIAQTPVSVSTNGAGALTINGLIQGTYSQVTVTLNNCTSDTTSQMILVDPTPPVINIVSSTNPTTCLGTEGTITLGGLTSGLTYSVNYKKNTVSQTPLSLVASVSGRIVINNLAAASYDNINVTINNCTSNDLGAVILTDPLPPVIGAGNNTPICQGDTIKLTATGPPGTSYTWTGPNSFTSSSKDTIIANSLPLHSGLYSLTGLLNNCTSLPSTTIVTVKPTPTTPVAGNNGPLCSGSMLNLTSSAVTNATYSWTGPNSFTSNTQNPSRPNVDVPDSGTYTVIATVDACPSLPGTTQVTIFHTPEIDTYAFSNPTTCLGSEGFIQLKGLGAAATYAVNYSKNGTPQATISITTDVTGMLQISGLTAGTYSVIFVTLNNCLSDTIVPVILTDPLPPVITGVSVSHPTTCLGTEGFITLNGLVPAATYSVNYTKDGIGQAPQTLTANGSGNLIIPSLGSGIYNNINVTINNCTSNSVGPDTLVDPLPPIISSSNNTPICEEDTLRLFANSVPGVLYSWAGPNLYATSVKDTVIINAQPSLSGVYTVTATLNNCTSEPDTTIVIVHPTPPLPNAANDGPYCTGNTIFLAADTIAGASYSWTGPLLFASSNQNPTVTNATVANSGKYYVTATVNGCISPLDSTAVAIYPPLAPVVGSSTISHPTTCAGTQGSITLTGLIPDSIYILTYTKGAVPQTPVNIQADLTGKIIIPNLGQGVYDDIKARLNICASDPVGPLILNDPLPPVLVVSNNTPVCQTDTIKLFASSVPGVIYNWTGPNGFTSSAKDTFVANALPVTHSGIYSVTGTLLNCTSNPFTTTVIVHSTPTVPVASNNGPLCPKDVLVLTASTIAGATYYWRGPNSYTSNAQNPAISNVNPLHSGDYVLSVTVNGCRSDSDTTTVLVNPTPVIPLFAVSHPTTCGGINGAIALSGLNINTSYTINYKKNGIGQTPQSLLSDGIGNLIIPNLSQGAYTQLTITLNNCVSDTLPPLYLTDPFPPTISASNNSPICQGDTIKLSGFGLPGVTYVWTGPSSFTSVSQDTFIVNAQAINGGVYSVIGTLNNCVSAPAITTVTIKPLPLKPNAANNGPLCEGGTLLLTSSTIPTAGYKWTGPNSYTSNNQNPLIANVTPAYNGKYWVSSIVNGCTSVPDTTTVLVHPKPLSPSVTTPLLLCQFDVAMPLTATGQSLLWYTTATGGIGNALAPTPVTTTPGTKTWWVTQTDGNGCESPRTTITVQVNQKPPKPLVATPVTYCQFETSVPLIGVGANRKWYTQASGGAFVTTTPTPSTSVAGTFNWWVSQTDANGCESDREIIVINVKPQPAPPGVTTVMYCDGDIAKNLTASGQSLRWFTQPTGGTGSSLPPIPSTADTGTTDYYVSQTVGGCESERAKLSVVVNPHVTADILTDRDTICQHDTLMLANAGTNPSTATFVWDFGGADIISSTSGEGPYTLNWSTNGIKTITVTVSNLNCIESDSKTIPVIESPHADFQLNDNACIAEILELRPYWDYANKYHWSFNDAIVKDTTKYDNYNIYWTTAGEKKVTLITEGKNGCLSKPHTHTTIVHENTTPSKIEISRNGICTGDTIQLSASANGSYTFQWAPTVYFYQNYRGDHVNGKIAKTGFVTLRTIDVWGCGREDSVMINTIPCCEAYLPNAFTPNNDGLNDKFKIITIGHHKILYFLILNRWGQEVFRTNDELDGWDGTFRGVPQDIGIYNYYIQYKCSNDKVFELKGELTLIK